MSRSKSRDDVFTPQHPRRSPSTPATPQLSINTTEEELSNTLAEIRDFVKRDIERPSDLSLTLPEKSPEPDRAAQFAAKPRKAKKNEGRTKIPMPVGNQQGPSQEVSLKRYDSGVDINVFTDSPSETSTHGEGEELLPWHQSSDSGLQYSSSGNVGQSAEQEYF